MRFHDLRHHLITELCESGTSEQTIKTIAGHVSQRILDRHSHIRLDAKRQALEALAIRRGIAALPQSRRRATLEAWLDKDLRARFECRILVIDQEVADRWGLLTAAARNSGIVLPVMDGLLAAIALEHNLTLVTRDTGQIPSMGVAVFNPWEKN